MFQEEIEIDHEMKESFIGYLNQDQDNSRTLEVMCEPRLTYYPNTCQEVSGGLFYRREKQTTQCDREPCLHWRHLEFYSQTLADVRVLLL